jgi:hypothetical protein
LIKDRKEHMEEPPMEKLPKPSRAATLHIIVKRDQGPDDRESGEDLPGNRILGWLWWLRWFIPATVEAWLTVPDAEAGRLLRMLERAAVAVTWSATVIGTLFAASAAHLPPIGTTIVVVLEIVVPPVAMLRARRGDDGK